MKNEFKKLVAYIKKHLKQLNKCICYICRTHNKFYLFILIDIIWCYIRYDVSYNEYRIFEFCNLNSNTRDTYLTIKRHKKLDKYLFDKKKSLLLKNNKEIFNTLSEYLKRDIYNVKDMSFKEFEVFCLDKKNLICRSNSNEFKVLHLDNFRSPAFMLDKINKEKLFWVEEEFKQHKSFNSLTDKLCILNIVSSYDGDNSDIVCGSLTVPFDECNLTLYIDIKTGKLKGNARDNLGKTYSESLTTNEKFKDFEIPKFKEVIDLVKKCQKKFPNIREIEWKLYVSSNKVIVLSASIWDDYNFVQIGEYNRNKVGLMPYYKNLINKIKY